VNKYCTLYLLIEKTQGYDDLERQAPELVETITEVDYPISVSTHEIDNLYMYVYMYMYKQCVNYD